MALPASLPVTGTEGNDTLFGNNNDNIVEGLGGNDSISGFAGDDQLVGGQGNDTINGGNDNDTLNGGTDNDQLNGESGDDILNGGTGNDTLNGGSGDDTYIYNLGDGDDVIIDVAGGVNIIQFGTGITESDIGFERINNENTGLHDLLITIGTGSIIVTNHFFPSLLSVQELRFADGNILTLPDNLAMVGTSGDDLLTGRDGFDDTISGQFTVMF